MGSFCVVMSRIVVNQFMFSMMDKDQRWNGGILILMRRGRLIIIRVLLFMLFMDMVNVWVIIIIEEEMDWMMKNLMDDSLNFLLVIRGIMVKEFISIIVHNMNQLFVDIIVMAVIILTVIRCMKIRKKVYYF